MMEVSGPWKDGARYGACDELSECYELVVGHIYLGGIEV